MRIFTRTLWLAMLTGWISAASAVVTVHVAPSGSDEADGVSAQTAVATLSRAEAIIRKQVKNKAEAAEVRFAGGVYRLGETRWEFSEPEHTIAFLPEEAVREPVVFDGEGKGTWFRLRGHKAGAATNLIFRRLAVRNYVTAISFEGERTKPESSSRGNLIEGCEFRNVGEKGTAVVRFVNSSGNWVLDCLFKDSVSHAGAGLLHGVYLAHSCCGNVIARNFFDVCSGDPVRLRDASNDNVVEENRFHRCGTNGAVSDWFCDHELEKDCTKPMAECASWRNVVRGNVIDRNYAGAQLEATFVYSQHRPADCAAPAEGERRLVATGNLQRQAP